MPDSSRGILRGGGRVEGHDDPAPLRELVFVLVDAGLVELLDREQGARSVGEEEALEFLLQHDGVAGVLALKAFPLDTGEVDVLRRGRLGEVNPGTGPAVLTLELVPGVVDQLPDQADALRRRGDHQPGPLTEPQRRHQALVEELKISDGRQLIEPAVRQVLAPDGVWFLGAEPADLRPVGQEDFLPVLVVVRYLDAAALRLGDDPRLAFDADGADVIVGGAADADVDVGLRQGHLDRPGRSSPRFSGPTTGQIEPNRPFGITRTWRAFRAVRDAVRAAAAVAAIVRKAMPRIIRRSLLRAGPAVLVVRLRLFPPAELREVQGVELLEETLLHPARPGLESFGEVRFGCHGSLPATVPVASPP